MTQRNRCIAMPPTFAFIPVHRFLDRDAFTILSMRRRLGFMVLALLLLFLFAGCTTSPGNDDTTSCTNNLQCVPAQCCHPTSCINVIYKEPCTEICTMECREPLDCGAGHCGCVDGKCQVIPGPGP